MFRALVVDWVLLLRLPTCDECHEGVCGLGLGLGYEVMICYVWCMGCGACPGSIFQFDTIHFYP